MRKLLPLAALIVTTVAIAQDAQPEKKQPLLPSQPEDRAESARRMSQLEQGVAKAVESYNGLRKKFIGPRPSEYRFAQYVEDWRNKVERVGALNYPGAARGKLYGTVVATVEIASDGTLRSVEIDRSSGHKILDDAVKRIVMVAAPYAPFPPQIARDTDIIMFTRSWHFTNNEKTKPMQTETDTPPTEETKSTAPNSLPAAHE